MGSYPDLSTALPATFVRPSKTSRILKPGIVLTAVVLLAAVSVLGLGVAAAILSSGAQRSKSTNALQALALIASSLSIIYIFIHGVAAKYNDPVGMVRPPELRLHAACFILARLALVIWIVVFFTACVVVSKPRACIGGSQVCQLQIADMVASIIGFIAAGVILTALESCKHPFEIPDILVARKIKSRGGPPGDEILDRSVSRASSFDAGPMLESEKSHGAMLRTSGIVRKPLPQRASEISDVPERPLTPLLSMSQRHRSGSRSWGEEWIHLAKQRGLRKKSASTSDSAVSLSYETSTGASEYTSTSGRSSRVSTPRRAVVTRRSVRQRQRSRTVTPSSSISNLSRRSPLSSVRSADYPHILVRPELRYCPPQIPPPHGWNSSRTSSISQLVPVADIQSLQRRPSFSTSENLVVQGPRHTLPPLPRSKPPITRRKTSDMKVPGAYVNERPSFDYEETLDEHVRKIEIEYVRRSQSKKNQHPSTFGKRQAGNFERLSPPPTRVNSKARYRERKRVPGSPSVSKPVAKIRPGSAHPIGTQYVEPETPKAFRRLSLGDISSGLGNLAGLGKMFD